MESENTNTKVGRQEPKALLLLLWKARKKLKIQRLKKATGTAEQKALRNKHVPEEKSLKHTKHKVTIRSYFQSSHNIENKAVLN